MSSFALAAQRVRERFAAQWGNTTDVRWDNQAAAGEPPGEFVEVWINEDGSSQIGMPAEINNAGSLIIRITCRRGAAPRARWRWLIKWLVPSTASRHPVSSPHSQSGAYAPRRCVVANQRRRAVLLSARSGHLGQIK